MTCIATGRQRIHRQEPWLHIAILQPFLQHRQRVRAQRQHVDLFALGRRRQHALDHRLLHRLAVLEPQVTTHAAHHQPRHQRRRQPQRPLAS